VLLEHGHFKGRCKHLHLRWCFVYDYIDTGVIRLVQTPSRDQLADIGTKACPAPQLKFQRSLRRGGLRMGVAVSPMASTSRRLSLLRAKWFIAHQTLVWYSLSCLSPLLCILVYLSEGGEI
jgi:hypothetical protein